jgi:hypothetical protein
MKEERKEDRKEGRKGGLRTPKSRRSNRAISVLFRSRKDAFTLRTKGKKGRRRRKEGWKVKEERRKGRR